MICFDLRLIQAHIFHGVKSLTSDLREMSEVSSSFLMAKKGIDAQRRKTTRHVEVFIYLILYSFFSSLAKGIGAALVPLMPSGNPGSATTQVRGSMKSTT